MKKQLLNLSLAIVTIAFFSVNAMAAKPEATIKKGDCAITVDGELEDVWKDLTAYDIALPFKEEVPSNTASWKAFYNDTAIFVLVEVDDDNFYSHIEKGVDWGNNWQTDKPEVYFDVNAVLEDGKGAGTTGANEGHYQIAPGFDPDVMGEIQSKDGRGAAIYATVWDADEADYVYEYSVNHSLLMDDAGDAYDITARTQIGFDVTIIDADDGVLESNRQRSVWANDGLTGGEDESWNNCDAIGIWNISTDAITCPGGDVAINKASFNATLITPTVASSFVNVPADALSVTFINSLGQVVKEVTNVTEQVDVTDLRSGIYFVGVKTEDSESFGRIIKQ